MDDTGEYIDSHCWVFTPRSLVETLDLANLLGALPFEIAILEPTVDNTDEFFVALRRLPEGQTKAQQRAAFLASRARIHLPPEEVSVDHLTLELAAARARVAAIESSTSWRITAPLRALVDRARSTVGRGA